MFFSKKDLLKALKEAGDRYPELNIGATYDTLLRYERNGVIVKPESLVANSSWRYYTKEQIEDAVERVIAYKKQVLDDTNSATTPVN